MSLDYAEERTAAREDETAKMAAMLNRVAAHGPNAHATAVRLLGTDLSLDEIEAAAECVARKAGEERHRQPRIIPG